MYEPVAHLTTPSAEIKPKEQIFPTLTMWIKHFYPTLGSYGLELIENSLDSLDRGQEQWAAACQGKHGELERAL